MPKLIMGEPVRKKKVKRAKVGSGAHGQVYAYENGRVRKYVRSKKEVKSREGRVKPENVRHSMKKFEDLAEVGCNIPKNITSNEKAKWLEWDDMTKPRGPKTDVEMMPFTADVEIFNTLNSGGDALAKKVAKEFALMHKANYAHHAVPILSSMQIVRRGKTYTPIVADVAHIKKARILKKIQKVMDIEEALKTVPFQRKKAFLQEYFKHHPSKWIKKQFIEADDMYAKWLK